MSYKYVVQRRDGSVPEWPWFVLGAADPCMPTALQAYADACEIEGMDPVYIGYLRAYAEVCDSWRQDHALGDPDAPRHREDDPETLSKVNP